MSDGVFFCMLFLFGGVAYVLLEYIWRGHSHWTMAVAGGTCLVLLYGVFTRLTGIPTALLCIIGATVITAVEFVTGAIVNRWLNWQVWDYSKRRFHLYGQVCLTYFILWGILCAPLVAFVGALSLLR